VLATQAALLSPEPRASVLSSKATDASGSSASNLRLSQARADEVRLYLWANSQPAAPGKGSAEPANARDPLSADNCRAGDE
jgi:outer membrane protein OmpA-like peptidoglycan-associated protein